MAYTNYLLFNNVFLQNLPLPEEGLASARHLVHTSARDWYRHADFSSPASMAATWIQPLLNQQSLDLVPCEKAVDAWTVVAPWERDAPLAVCLVAPHGVSLDGLAPDGSLPKGQHWMIRAVELARSQAGRPLRWAVLTNGVQWRLLDAQALRRYEAYLEIDLYGLLNGEDDPLAAYLFYRLLRLEDALEWEAEAGRNRLDAFLEQSARATEATEAYLKTTVSDNLNTPGGGDGIMAQLAMGIVQAVDPSGARPFDESERQAIYRDATYLLYRLLFILYAEARRLLPLDNPRYKEISLERLVAEAKELRQDPARLAEKPASLWRQLDDLCNTIYHSDEVLGVPPYNGGLFDNKDKPYLRQHAIHNTYLADALVELAFLQVANTDAPPAPIDYRDLSVRHLGSLYEGMIEYRLFIAAEELLARRDKDGKVAYLPAAKTARKPTDELVRPGKVYFAQSPHERKATGTHYTAEDLVARLVKQTVGRLLEERWAAFEPKYSTWLGEVDAALDEAARQRLQAHLDHELENFIRQQALSLRICDPAMGSGHFLVYIAHYLTAFIVSVLSRTPWENPAVNLNPDHWRRQVVENCLFGVDINELAVELAKLSLWLASMQLGRPLSFLDHHLKQGNSLLGVDLEEISAALEQGAFNQPTRQQRQAEGRGQMGFRELPQVQRKLAQANDLLGRIAARQVQRVGDVAEQEVDHAAIQALLKPYKAVGNLLAAQKMGWKMKDRDLRAMASALEAEAPQMLSAAQGEMLAQAQDLLAGQRTFHWMLEYPQVFLHPGEGQGGFDVVIGNPPFLGGAKISTEIGDRYLEFLKRNFEPTNQNTDLCAYFFRQGFKQLFGKGYLGLVATNTIAEGDTREGGLEVILGKGGEILSADKYVKWPGDASVEVNLLVITPASNRQNFFPILDGNPVSFISSWLDDLPEDKAKRLYQNRKKAFLGSVIHGKGFILSFEEAHKLIQNNPLNKDCIFPFLTGKDINSDPNQNSSRAIIYFEDWNIDQAEKYPEILTIVREKVKPYRDTLKGKGYREKWWLYGRNCLDLRLILPTLSQALIRSRVSELHSVAFVPKGQVYSDATVVFAYDDHYHFSIIQSDVHETWLRRHASTLRTDIRYTPTDCFQTFPFPQELSEQHRRAAEQAGQVYYEHRQQIMQQTQLGLTKTYNRFHDPACQDGEIEELRQLHAGMDQAVLACYGWDDIELQHDFYPNERKKIRYMPCRTAQREIFTRLLALNQEIAAREEAQGLVVEQGAEEEIEDAE